MVYALPVYKDLHKATSLLQQSFNLLAHRYIPPTYEVLREAGLNMPTVY